VQLTHKSNYEKWSGWLGIDLVSNPDILIEDKSLSAKVLISGLKHGSWTATGGIENYIKDGQPIRYNEARSIVNGDWWNAQHITNITIQYEQVLTDIKY